MVPGCLSPTLRGHGFLCFAISFAVVQFAVRCSSQKTNIQASATLSFGSSSSPMGGISLPIPTSLNNADGLSRVRAKYVLGTRYEHEDPPLVLPRTGRVRRKSEHPTTDDADFSFLSTGAWMTQRKLGRMFLSKVSAQMDAREAAEKTHLSGSTEAQGEELAVWEGRGPRSWHPASDLRLRQLNLTAFQPGWGAAPEEKEAKQQQEKEGTHTGVRRRRADAVGTMPGTPFRENDVAKVQTLSGASSRFSSLSEPTRSSMPSSSTTDRAGHGTEPEGHSQLRSRFTLRDLRSSVPDSPRTQPVSVLHSSRSALARGQRLGDFGTVGASFAQARSRPSTVPAGVSHLQVGATTQIIDALLATALSGGATALAQSGGMAGGQQLVIGGMQPLALQGPAYPAPLMMPYAAPPPEPGMSTTEIVLIAIGACLGVGILLAALYVVFCSGRRRRRR